jgi:hypothetical protein
VNDEGDCVCRKERFPSFFEYLSTLREWENLANVRTIKSSGLRCMVRFIVATGRGGFEYGLSLMDVVHFLPKESAIGCQGPGLMRYWPLG